MNILDKKVEELLNMSSVDLTVAYFENHEEACVIANKSAEKIVVLMSNKDYTKLKSYSVSLENWLKAEDEGLNSEQIVKGLSVLRAFGRRPGQRYISKGDVFQQIDMSEVALHLEITS
ncbi:hypothetical protein CMI37_22115 [Candidatus Pacearchaeota archaeon]|nr:hypothetical protein [Candidatus Pacearchaeota archaeon]